MCKLMQRKKHNDMTPKEVIHNVEVVVLENTQNFFLFVGRISIYSIGYTQMQMYVNI